MRADIAREFGDRFSQRFIIRDAYGAYRLLSQKHKWMGTAKSDVDVARNGSKNMVKDMLQDDGNA
jgi:hypothetical protein